MGRGRAKAKQQKVARELKYNSQPTNLDALQRELRSSTSSTDTIEFDGDDPDEDADERFPGNVDDPGDWPGSAPAR